MKKRLLALTLCTMAAPSAFAAQEVNVYSNRQDELIKPIITQFERESGIKVNLVFAKDGLTERLQREGKLTPADLMLTTDISRLTELVDKDLVQPVQSPVLEQNIPAALRDPDDRWFALTTRVRAIYSSKDRLGKLDAISYEDLAKPEYKGKICVRSGKNDYNVALVASMIAHHGKADAKQWLEGLKANLARKPQGNDRDQVKAIKDGVCDLSLGNSYYLGKMLADPAQKAWADAVYINFPNQQNRGAHVNVSGMAMTKFAKNKEAAVKLMEFLSGDEAQHLYADLNTEYPVKPGVERSPLVKSWGDFKADSLPVSDYARLRKDALTLLDEVKFDL
ncbi:Fe(3+) ABC transporter substrate-binding protein [Aeromonas simiae]|uniref:Fe(3+) ABC transporter substrate-binding protein n=1 Tax=Aeromonas simiae TaxID=218936 RepID=A0A5J6WY31_9GAMM|nr:Fe(3+) ABC transporter substrate-binding protein [Aeromonas simiae]MDO2948599.1 Fe(3+) ABC transporter substrate-binding protein [Aeromonas simiae]MDO2952081.1 Fe(3+) ABC transporter substrate-binding protein [Aeromonas simiae]MDO2955982.1 Fe(3+) ABC transporter substrate-binding protein [Aeromonas simiae]QFI56066.1 Fe(3+) ABC transporter substrate-binding protein [Aeromonas simiae]